MDILDEIEKASHGEPSKVKLAPIPEEEIKREELLHRKGYKFAFGEGFKDRQEMIDSLPNIGKGWPLGELTELEGECK
jgi:hypothetical protein